MTAGLNTVNILGAIAGVVAIGILVTHQPEAVPTAHGLPPVPEASTRPLVEPLTHQLRPDTLRLHNLSPPILAASSLDETEPIGFRVSLPPDTLPWDLFAGNRPLVDAPWGATLEVDPSSLHWGLNPIHVEGVDCFGRPLDSAWPLLVGDTVQGDGWVERALVVELLREGFLDEDDRLDDLSSIAKRQVRAILGDIPAIEVGPVTVSHFRVSSMEVDLEPQAGSIRVHLGLNRVYVDVEVDPFGVLDNFVINRIWLDARLSVDADVLGRPRVRLLDIEPHIDLVATGEGVVNWILDHAAWFVEITAELMSQEPLQEAITSALDNALGRWVSHLQFSSVAPLSRQVFDVGYRFSEIRLDELGLTASVDFRVGCEGDRPRPIGRLVRPESRELPRSAEQTVGQTDSVVRVRLSSDAVNGALHALWRCGALDTRVEFAEAQSELPLFVPESISTHFRLPPVLQSGDDGGMVIGVGGLTTDVAYTDVTYEVGANGILPIFLESTPGGHALAVGFGPDLANMALYTDCQRIGRRPCRDNALFDRLAWLAVPFLPPIGATIPLPDLRLTDDPDAAVELRLDQLSFEARTGLIQVLGSYEIPRR